MYLTLIFLPALFHMLLVFGLFILLGKAKTKAIADKLVDPKETALNPKAWPDSVVKISNNIANQFETPILFYVITFVIYASNSANFVALGLLSLYTLSRYVHAYIHVTSNYVPNRFKVFVFGLLILMGLTIWQVLLIIQLI